MNKLWRSPAGLHRKTAFSDIRLRSPWEPAFTEADGRNRRRSPKTTHSGAGRLTATVYGPKELTRFPMAYPEGCPTLGTPFWEEL